MVEGYVAGFNAELAEEGRTAGARARTGCRRSPSRTCTPTSTTSPSSRPRRADHPDRARRSRRRCGAGTRADIPSSPEDTSDIPVDTTDPTRTDIPSTRRPRRHDDDSLGSNGWAIGSELSDSGGGMLLANPHFPWEGEKRLWESHLTLTTGELDVYGATLSGVPGVLIGFNDAVAWTHTVSAGHRFTLYELTLTPESPTTYVYGDETREMSGEELTVEVLREDGSVEKITRTMWKSTTG
jgi:acyl-homoserine lactone acylase PvdQ